MTRDTKNSPSVIFVGAPLIAAESVAVSAAAAAPIADKDHGSALNDVLALPSTLKTEADSPVLLGALLGGGVSRFEFVRINGVPVGTGEATPLPGIRVGHGDGSGFVLRRALDGELVFVPDREFRGTTTFGYTVVDLQGTEATCIAKVVVQPDILADGETEIASDPADAPPRNVFVDVVLSAEELKGIEGNDAQPFCFDDVAVSSQSDQFLDASGNPRGSNPRDVDKGRVSLRIVRDEDAVTDNVSVHWLNARQGSVSGFAGVDDFFRFLESAAEQEFGSLEGVDVRDFGDDPLEVVEPGSLIDWLIPPDEGGSTEQPQVPFPATGEPFGD